MMWNNNSIWKGTWSGFWTDFWGFGDACNFTNYSSGPPINFVQVEGMPTSGAPITSIDKYIGNDDANSIIALDPIGFCHLDDWVLEFTVNVVNSTLFRKIYTEGDDGNANHKAIFQAGSSDPEKLFIQITNAAGNATILSEQIPYKIFDGITHDVRIEKSGTDLISTVDNFSSTQPTIGSMAATSAFPDPAIGGFIFGGSIDASFAGKVWDFNVNGISIPINEGTGTDIKSSTGTSVGTLTDPNGVYWDYYLPSSIIPTTGPLQCREDSVSNTSITSTDFSGDWIISGVMTPLETSGFDVYFNYGRLSGASSGIVVYTASTGEVSFEVRDDIGTFSYLYVNTEIMDIKTTYEIKKAGTTITTTLNGILVDTDATVDLTTNGCTINSVAFGASNATSSKSSVDHYSAGCDLIDDWNFETRLPGAADINANKIIGTSNGIVLSIIDNTPHGIYFPYIGKYDSVLGPYLVDDNYLVGDTCVIVSAGGTPP